jgi:positive regulator of sigma E activity
MVHDLPRVNRALLPWLLPLAMVLAVVVMAFAPTAVAAVIGIVVLAVLGYVGVPLYYRHSRQRGDRGGSAR